MDALRPLLSGNLLARVGLDQTRMYLASLLLGAAGKPLDVLYSRLGGFNGGFFEQGWGDLGVVNFREDLELIRRWPPGDLKVSLALSECQSMIVFACGLRKGVKLLGRSNWQAQCCSVFCGRTRGEAVHYQDSTHSLAHFSLNLLQVLW